MNSDWFGIGGGDGFQTAVDPTDFNVVYTESQDGTPAGTTCERPRADSIRPRGPAADGRGRRWGSRSAPPRPPVVAAGRGSGAPTGAVHGGRAPSVLTRRGSVPVQLEYAVHAVAAQSEHRVARRQSTLQVAESRGHVGRERGPHEAARPQEGLSDERARAIEARLSQNDGVVALQHDRLCLGIASACLASSGPARTTGTCR